MHDVAAGLEAELLNELTPEDKAERKRRTREMKVAKERQRDLLSRMAEEAKRQKVDEDKKKARMQKRAQIKRDRILFEAAERKRVLAEEARLAGTESCIEDAAVQVDTKKGAPPPDFKARGREAAAAAARRAAAEKARADKQGGETSEDVTEELDEEAKKLKKAAQNQRRLLRLHCTKRKPTRALPQRRERLQRLEAEKWVPLDAKVFSIDRVVSVREGGLLKRGWFQQRPRVILFRSQMDASEQ